MKRSSIISLAFCTVLISACAAKSNINWLIPESERTNYAAVPTDWIAMFRQDLGDSIPQDYVQLAAITVSTDDGLDKLTGTLRKEAGRVGANAIIVVQYIWEGGSSTAPQPREATCEVPEVSDGDNAPGLGTALLVCGLIDLFRGLEDTRGRSDSYGEMTALLVHFPLCSSEAGLKDSSASDRELYLACLYESSVAAAPSRLPEEPVSTACFTLGSSKDVVRRIMGTPSGIYRSGDWWSYSSAHVEFDSRGRVDGYANIGGRLRLCE